MLTTQSIKSTINRQKEPSKDTRILCTEFCSFLCFFLFLSLSSGSSLSHSHPPDISTTTTSSGQRQTGLFSIYSTSLCLLCLLLLLLLSGPALPILLLLLVPAGEKKSQPIPSPLPALQHHVSSLFLHAVSLTLSSSSSTSHAFFARPSLPSSSSSSGCSPQSTLTLLSRTQ